MNTDSTKAESVLNRRSTGNQIESVVCEPHHRRTGHKSSQSAFRSCSLVHSSSVKSSPAL